MKTQFIPIDYDYFDFQGRNYAKIIGRDEKGKKICVIDSCDVYLWAILKDKINSKEINKLVDEIKKIKLELKGRKTKVEKVEVKDKKFLGKKVKALKIYATNYKDLHDIADRLDFPEIEKRRGYDLGYTTHYIIEKKIKPLHWYEIQGQVLNNSQELGGIDSAIETSICINLESSKELKEEKFKPKALGYDIETDELGIGEGQILMISFYSDKVKKVLTWKKLKNKQPKYVEYVKDEAELIEKFVQEVKEISPDFLIGYNSDGFDLPYIKARAEHHNVKIPLGIDGSQPRFSRGAGTMTAKIFGTTHIDLLKFIRTAYAQYMKSETLTLDEVSKEFLKNEKKDFEFKPSSKLTQNDLEKFYEYNLHDSKLVIDLFEKFWPDLLEFTKTIQEPTFEISRAGLSKYTESYILHNLERFNEIPEKRPGYNEINSRRNSGGVEGAFVLEPTPGLYKDIVIFDFTSMHTSIIITYNISKSTLLEKKKKDSYKSPEVELNGKKQNFYFTKKPGFFPELLKEIFQLRKKFKQEYKKNPNPITLARSNAFKVLSASAHGYIGFFGARYYSIEASASILGFVRQFNKETIQKIKDAGYQVIFGDTDSVGFTKKEKTEKEIKEFLEKLNSELPGVMHLELEGFFKRGIWVTKRSGDFGAKKKYALIDKNDKLKIRGFETVRRDWCMLAREVQNKVLELVLKQGNEKKAVEYVKEIVSKVKKRDIDKSKLVIKTQLKKPLSEYKATTPHVVAAQKMKEKEIPISSGGLVEYYIAESKEKNPLVRDRVKLPDEKEDYDIKYYLEKQILPAIENILQTFKINVKDLTNNSNQKTLDGF